MSDSVNFWFDWTILTLILTVQSVSRSVFWWKQLKLCKQNCSFDPELVKNRLLFTCVVKFKLLKYFLLLIFSIKDIRQEMLYLLLLLFLWNIHVNLQSGFILLQTENVPESTAGEGLTFSFVFSHKRFCICINIFTFKHSPEGKVMTFGCRTNCKVFINKV